MTCSTCLSITGFRVLVYILGQCAVSDVTPHVLQPILRCGDKVLKWGGGGVATDSLGYPHPPILPCPSWRPWKVTTQDRPQQAPQCHTTPRRSSSPLSSPGHLASQGSHNALPTTCTGVISLSLVRGSSPQDRDWLCNAIPLPHYNSRGTMREAGNGDKKTFSCAKGLIVSGRTGLVWPLEGHHHFPTSAS